jgi:hypothetical protein
MLKVYSKKLADKRPVWMVQPDELEAAPVDSLLFTISAVRDLFPLQASDENAKETGKGWLC